MFDWLRRLLRPKTWQSMTTLYEPEATHTVRENGKTYLYINSVAWHRVRLEAQWDAIVRDHHPDAIVLRKRFGKLKEPESGAVKYWLEVIFEQRRSPDGSPS